MPRKRKTATAMEHLIHNGWVVTSAHNDYYQVSASKLDVTWKADGQSIGEAMRNLLHKAIPNMSQ